MSDLTPETIDKIRQLCACRGVEVADGECAPFVVVPNDCKVHSLADFVKPKFINANPQFRDIESFLQYVIRFMDASTTVFASPGTEGVTFVAILDYHEGATAEWCKHRATYCSEITPELKAWRAANRKQMGQVEFATWLEDNGHMIADPAGADLLELVKNLHGHKNARFMGEVRLATGNYSVGWEEETVVRGAAAVSSGNIELPKIITAGIAPFYGAANYAVQARLKTKVEDRKLYLWYETIAEHVIMRDSINLIVARVKSELKRPVLIGTP